MKVVHVNTFHLTGGAARAAFQLHKSLYDHGVDSWFFCRIPDDDTPNTYCYNFSNSPRVQLEIALRHEKLNELRHDNLQNVSPICEAFSSEWDVIGGELCEQIADADIINLHWVANFVDIPVTINFAKKHGIPVVWTLHDMNPFTGGCHYNIACRKFEAACGACLQLNSVREDDWSSSIQKAKIDTFRGLSARDITITTPSNWLADEVRASSAMGHLNTVVLPYSVDQTVYKPHNKCSAREIAGLPQDVGILLFIAQNVDNYRKGMDVLQDALMHYVNTPNLHLVIIGATAQEIYYPFPCSFFGTIKDDSLASIIFAAADAIVLPSRQDNLPNTMLEALACGTAVIGSDVGGIPDFVIPEQTGFLFPVGDAQGLGDAIDDAFSDMNRLCQYGCNGRELAEQKLTSTIQANAYLDLYQNLLDRKGG